MIIIIPSVTVIPNLSFCFDPLKSDNCTQGLRHYTAGQQYLLLQVEVCVVSPDNEIYFVDCLIKRGFRVEEGKINHKKNEKLGQNKQPEFV